MNSVKIRFRGWIQQQVKIYDSLQNYVIELDIAQRTACILFLKHLISLKANICNMTIDKRIKAFDSKWNRECKSRMKVDIKLSFNFKDEQDINHIKHSIISILSH